MEKIVISRKNIFAFCLMLVTYGLLVTGCATTPSYVGGAVTFSPSDYVSVENFCKKHGFQYSYDTIDDLVRLYSSDKEIKVLLNSFVGAINGSIFYLKVPPVYRKGKILIPRQLDKFVSSRTLSSFRPTFVIKTIVIDPGHGGRDPGAISPRGLEEKTINLMVAKYLKEELEGRGFKVILTRLRDVFISLDERVRIARRHHADFFISLHSNSNRSRNVDGVEIYHLPASRLNSRERALKLAKSEDFSGRELPTNVKAILWDLIISKNYAFSVEMSNIMYFTFKNLGFNVRPPKKASFHVLRLAYVPSILVEMGYLSNAYEEKALRKKYYQRQIAQAVSLAISSLNKRYAKGRKTRYANLNW